MTGTTTVDPESNMLIDGKLVESSTGRTFDNVNPATEEVIGAVTDGSTADMQRAITAARRAFDETDWSTNRAFRKQCLEQLQDALETEKEQMREQLILEVGCPRMLTAGPQLDVPLSDALRYPIQLIDDFEWEHELPDATDFRGGVNSRLIVKEPVGVVGAITPWNFPFEVALAKLGQALATGNTVVLKPAPDTPWNSTLIGRLVAERTDIPAGVVNIVTSSDHLVGEELTLSPEVDLISFTGSTAVGKRIMEKGAATMKRLFLELGGKSATIVLDDADFDSALLVGLAVCSHAGQGCAIPTRMLLPRSRYDEGVERLTSYFGMVPYGDPQREDVIMGPVISAKQRDRVTRVCRSRGRRRCHPGGRRRSPRVPTQGVLRRANYVHRCGQFDGDRPGGDLRTRPGRHSVRGRRRRRANRQRQWVRPQRRRLLGLVRPVHGRGPSGAYRHHERQRWSLVWGRRALRRVQGQRRRAAERDRRVRPVPGDQVPCVAECLIPGMWTPPPGAGNGVFRFGVVRDVEPDVGPGVLPRHLGEVLERARGADRDPPTAGRA